MGLDGETLRRMAKCFAGRACCRCGTAAVRLAHGHFYCDRHFPLDRGGTVRPPKVRRCLLSG
jgi:alkylation response protein AidB-like acyl-CoA dehydrogenase